MKTKKRMKALEARVAALEASGKTVTPEPAETAEGVTLGVWRKDDCDGWWRDHSRGQPDDTHGSVEPYGGMWEASVWLFKEGRHEAPGIYKTLSAAMLATDARLREAGVVLPETVSVGHDGALFYSLDMIAWNLDMEGPDVCRPRSRPVGTASTIHEALAILDAHGVDTAIARQQLREREASGPVKGAAQTHQDVGPVPAPSTGTNPGGAAFLDPSTIRGYANPLLSSLCGATEENGWLIVEHYDGQHYAGEHPDLGDTPWCTTSREIREHIERKTSRPVGATAVDSLRYALGVDHGKASEPAILSRLLNIGQATGHPDDCGPIVDLPPDADGAVFARCKKCGDDGFPVNDVAAGLAGTADDYSEPDPIATRKAAAEGRGWVFKRKMPLSVRVYATHPSEPTRSGVDLPELLNAIEARELEASEARGWVFTEVGGGQFVGVSPDGTATHGHTRHELLTTIHDAEAREAEQAKRLDDSLDSMRYTIGDDLAQRLIAGAGQAKPAKDPRVADLEARGFVVKDDTAATTRLARWWASKGDLHVSGHDIEGLVADVARAQPLEGVVLSGEWGFFDPADKEDGDDWMDAERGGTNVGGACFGPDRGEREKRFERGHWWIAVDGKCLATGIGTRADAIAKARELGAEVAL